MSFILGSLGSSIACCFGSAFCSLCCTACPSCKGSTSTRLAYSLILFAGIITSCVMLIPDLDKALMKVPYLCLNPHPTNSSASSNICSDIVGSLAVYRLSFGMAIFFLILSLLMIKVRTSNNWRARIQNGFWAFKLIILIGIVVGVFYIPHNGFDFAFMIIGFIGAFLFILFQLFLSIDFVHSWNESWVDHVESGSKKHGYGLLLSTFLFYILTIIGVILFYKYYALNGHDCPLNTFLISFNIILCILLSIISISPCVRAYNSSCGLLQSSFVTLYVMYYTWSAMSNHPLNECNPSFINSNNTDKTKQRNLSDPVVLIGLIMFICALIYSVITSSRNNRARKLFLSSTATDSGILDDAQLVSSASDHKWILGSDEENHQRVYDDERGSLSYNYSMFHVMLILATLYAMMTLTNWYDPSNNFEKYNHSYASLWVKIISSWLCVLLYVWSCIAPAVFPDRDFS